MKRQFKLEFSAARPSARELLENLLGIAAEKIHQLAERLAIFLLALPADTGAAAHLDMVIETGALILPGDDTLAVEIGKDAAQGVKRLITGPCTGVGAKIAGTILLHLAHNFNLREVVLPVDLDIGKILSS
jgi:hypothetical protein